ncbi:MAG: translocation/assembly module TamB domain-containing protein [Pseudomonadota bacterium]
MRRLHPRWLLRTAWHLVLAVVGLAYLLVVRSALWVFTLIIGVYFAVNDPGLSSQLLSLVNDAIPGTISAERIHWEPFRSRIHVFGVVISRPGDVPVIQAARVSTDMRLGALIGYLVVGGEDDPLPLIFDRTLVRDGIVDLEFRDSGLLLVQAFVEPDKPPSPDPTPVKLQMHDIRIENTRVRLDFFEEWGLLVRGVDLDGEVGLLDGIVTVGARDLLADSVELLGTLPVPDSLAFLTRPVQGFRTSRFHLHGDSFEIIDASGRARRFDFRLSGTMDFSPDRPLSLESVAVVRVPDPTVLGEITSGTVTGALDAAVTAKGPLEAANLVVSVRSPRVEVLGVPFDDVEGAVSLNLANPTLVRVQRLGTWLYAGRIDAEDVLIHAVPGPGELVRIGGLACMEGADPAAVALGFGDVDIRSLSPLLDGVMSGCVGVRNLRVTEDDVSMSLALDVAVGSEVDPRTGLGGAWSAGGNLSLDLQGVETSGLEVVAGQDRVSLEGGFTWDPELFFDLVADAWSPAIGRHLEAMDVPGVDGDLTVQRLVLRGPLAAPEVDLEATVAGLLTPVVAGDLTVHRLALRGTLEAPDVDLEATMEGVRTPVLDLAQVELDARLVNGDIVVRRLAWADPLTDGAIAGDVARVIGSGPRLLDAPWRVGIEAIAPLRVPLDLLVPDEGILGQVRLDSLFVDGRIGTRAQDLLRDLRVAGEGVVMDLTSPAGSVHQAAIQFSAEARRERGMGEPRLEASLQIQGEGLDFGGLTLGAVEASASVRGIPLRFDLGVLSMISGDVTVEARSVAKDFLAFRDLAVDLHYPEGGDAVLAGKVQVVRGVGARIEGGLARKDLQGHARLRFDRMPMRSLPLPKSVREDLDPIRDALISGQVRVEWPALGPLLDLPAQKILPRLNLRGDLKALRLETLPEPVREVAAKVTLKGGILDLPEFRVTLASGYGLRGKASLNLDRMTGVGRVTWSPIDLRALKILAPLDLPVQARVGGRLAFEGALARPRVDGALHLLHVQTAGIDLGDAELDFKGQVGDSIRISSDRFFEGFTLSDLRIDFDGLEPIAVDAVLGFEGLTLARILPEAALPVAVTATGAAQIHVNTQTSGTMVDASIFIEDGGLVVEIPALARLLETQDREEAWDTGTEVASDADVVFRIVNRGPVDLVATERGAGTTCLRLATPIGDATLSGEVDLQRGYALEVGGALDLQRLAFLSPWLARLRGTVNVGSGDVCEAPGGGVRIRGALEAPTLDGTLGLSEVDALVRGYPHEIRILEGVLAVSGDISAGALRLNVPQEARIEARHDDGAISLWGSVDFAEWLPARIDLDAVGSGIFFAVPRQYRLTMNPTLHLSLTDPLDPKRAQGLLEGRIDVTEGQFYRNFDRLLGSFATAFSRSQERYSRPITEVIPFLRVLDLDLEVRSTDFTVSSRFPFGETDMEVDVDLAVRGTLDDLEVHDRLTLLPGGMITYKVVKREFEIQSGYADFTGDPGKPVVDVKAVTTINRASGESGGAASPTEKIWGRDVNITVHVYGTYPDLRFDLSSDSGEYDQADLQTLLLLGMTRRDLEGQGFGEGSTVSINLLTDDVARAVSDLLLSPFLDAVSLGFTRDGGIQAETLTKVGRAMHLTTKVAQETDLQEYTAGFRFMLTDRLFLEGRMKMKQNMTETNQNYEGRLLYRIPLE